MTTWPPPAAATATRTTFDAPNERPPSHPHSPLARRPSCRWSTAGEGEGEEEGEEEGEGEGEGVGEEGEWGTGVGVGVGVGVEVEVEVEVGAMRMGGVEGWGVEAAALWGMA